MFHADPMVPVVSNGTPGESNDCSRRLLLLSSVARYRDLNGHVHCPVGMAFVTC